MCAREHCLENVHRTDKFRLHILTLIWTLTHCEGLAEFPLNEFLLNLTMLTRKQSLISFFDPWALPSYHLHSDLNI